MEMDYSDEREINREIGRIEQLLSMADTVIVNREERKKAYEKALFQLFSTYKRLSRNRKLFAKLHEIGLKKHNQFRCKIPFKDGEYWTECPVKLAHFPLPLGISMGAAISKVCSICGKEPLDCNHVKGKHYDQIKCIRLEYGYCNICLMKECGHVEGQFYDNVQAVAVVKDLKFDHVAMVSNPLEPDAGIMSIAIDRNEILRSLFTKIHQFKWGDDLYCEHCLTCKDY